MDQEMLKKLLQEIQKGKITIAQGMRRLRDLPYEGLGFAHIDHHRSLRPGAPEVIFCEGKTAEQVREIARALRQRGGTAAATRATPEKFEAIREGAPEAQYHERARMVAFGDPPPAPDDAVGPLLIATGGLVLRTQTIFEQV